MTIDPGLLKVIEAYLATQHQEPLVVDVPPLIDRVKFALVHLEAGVGLEEDGVVVQELVQTVQDIRASYKRLKAEKEA